MMYDFWLAWRNVASRKTQSAVAALVVSLAIGLSVAVFTLTDGVQEGILRAADPYNALVVGPKGSAQQLALNTLLLQDVPLGTIPWEIVSALRADSGVRTVIPIGMGDNVGGAPIVGVDLSFFELRPNLAAPPSFQLANGRLFVPPSQENNEEDIVFEATLGFLAATQLNLNVGDRFQGTHGLAATKLEGEHHETLYEVVGILKPSQTPYDAAVFVPIQSVWASHAHKEESSSGTYEEVQAASEGSVTAILVVPVSYSDAYRIWQEFYARPDAQAVFPGEQLGRLFDFLNVAAQAMNGVGILVLAVAAFTVFLSIYNAASAREQSLAVIRSLGGSRGNIFRMILFEAFILTLVGSLIGRGIGYGVASIVATLINKSAFIPVPVRFQAALEFQLWISAFLVALLAGLIPAIMAYRVNIAEKLFPSL